ncbi:MAG: hypothetical protein U9R58_13670, partial [Chloroflexota bacterium]|nr:hypothetical protein [Chloroflexota bacterium]
MEKDWMSSAVKIRGLSITAYVLVATILFLVLVGCRDRDHQSERTNPVVVNQPTTPDESGITGAEDRARLAFRLSGGQAQPQTEEEIPLAESELLSEGEVALILARLSVLTAEVEDQLDFRVPEEPLPPPRTGETITETFPPPPVPLQPDPVAVGELEVLRYSPEGEISLAPFVSVSFNQPMVPLATIEDLAEDQVPVRVEPALPGTWRWIGTKTLTFQYDSELVDRLPMATEYMVTIPAGTESAVGGELTETVSWTFSTPPVKMIARYPGDDPQPLNPLFFVAFDQRIDPQAVLNTIEVTADNQPTSLVNAVDLEIELDKDVSRLVERTGEGRWLAFRVGKTLPADAYISVSIGPGTPSAEGPLVTEQEQGFSFHTYAPLRIQDHGCSWRDDVCRPLTPLYIEFNNPIDINAYDESMLSIDPVLPGATVDIVGDRTIIRGASEGQATYEVTVDGSIQDVFGQTLGEDARLRFRIGPAEAMLFGPDQILVTLDPAAKTPIFSVYAINYNKLNLKIYAVEPSDWTAFKEYLRDYQRTDRPSTPPGRLVLDRSTPVEAPSDSLTEVGIDLSKVMDGDFGHFIVIVEPPNTLTPFDEYPYWQVVQAWIQVTQIGLDAFADHSELVVWTTDLQDG